MKKFALAAAIVAASVSPVLANEATPATDDLTILSTQGAPLGGFLGAATLPTTLTFAMLGVTVISVAGQSTSGSGTN